MKKIYEYNGSLALNFVPVPIDRDDVIFRDIRTEPQFDVYGFYDYRNTPIYTRLPENIASLSTGLTNGSSESAGGRIRFTTDSQYIAIRAEYVRVGANARTPQVGIAGFDVYVDNEYESRFYRPMIPPIDVKDGFETMVGFCDRKERHITVNFPFHTVAKKVEIGLQADATLSHGLPYRNEKPVIIYGSSITHGSCASRPGLIYENILSRRLNLNYTNLGFGGSARGEKEIAEYMAGLPMSMFISDYDHNSSYDGLLETHYRLYETIRGKNPDIPYLMISRPDFAYAAQDSSRRRSVIAATYLRAMQNGDRNVYYLDGSTMFNDRDWDNCFADTVHPNDIGFLKMADAIEPIIARAMFGAM